MAIYKCVICGSEAESSEDCCGRPMEEILEEDAEGSAVDDDALRREPVLVGVSSGDTDFDGDPDSEAEGFGLTDKEPKGTDIYEEVDEWN